MKQCREIMKQKMPLAITLMLLIFSLSCLANPVKLLNMQVLKPAKYNMRLVFKLNSTVTHKVFTLRSPNRLVIDFTNTKLIQKLKNNNHIFLKKIRSATRNNNDLRVVLDLTMRVRSKSFLIKSQTSQGYNLIIDLTKWGTKPRHISRNIITTEYYQVPKTKREFVIAIDAGHGGKDPGAIGWNGTHEKKVVLAVAKELARLVTKEAGMRPVMIRNGDYFVKLHKRLELARKHKADLFVSIHADAYPDNQEVQGSSVFMLSQKGASSEAAKWLAEKENAVDLMGGINLNNKDNLLAEVLLSLSQAGTLKASANLGESVLKRLNKVGKLHSSRLQRANFVVLRSPDIPSILVETAFLSNPSEERKINSPYYRRRIATAIMLGIREYFAKNRISFLTAGINKYNYATK
jgi:N-acetylmuramoyl-L-alanine amidase